MKDFESLAVTTEGAPSLLSGSSGPSDRNALPTPTTSVGAMCTTREEIFSNTDSQWKEAHSSGFSQDIWSDFLVQDYLSSSEPIGKSAPEDNFGSWNDSVDLNCTDLGDVCVDIAKMTRFSHKLEAPPALQRESGENPTTYLNKGAPYSLSVEDTACVASESGTVLYCTTIQVAFDSVSQREQPLASWRLWNQSRGRDQGRLFDGRFQAVEYLSSHNPENPNYMSNIQVVHSDGCSLLWSADRNRPKTCSIKFQLNFLSTDFSHAKGIHGATMRFCAKTEEVSPDSLRFPVSDHNISYCRIQVFRSHGAERKTVNDAASISKRIAKLKQKLQSAEDFSNEEGGSQGKRKKITTSGNAPKRARRGGKDQEDAMRSEVKDLQGLCTVGQGYSDLGQHGERQQHCDWYPRSEPDVHHPGRKVPISPAHSPGQTNCDMLQHPTATAVALRPEVKKTSRRQNASIACFYARSVESESECYRPIYLSERTADELMGNVAAFVSADATKIIRFIWLCDKGLKILIDDDVVQNMKEGQGMQVTTTEVRDDLLEMELEF